MVAADRRADAGRFEVRYLFAQSEENWFVEAVTLLPPGDPAIDSLATFHYPASRFEREIYDLFGIAADRPSRSPAARAPRLLAGRLLSAAQGRERRASSTDDGRAFPVHRGGRRGRVRDPGGSGARRRDRARALPLQRGGRDHHRHEVAPVLHAQGHREALRGTARPPTASSWPSASPATRPSGHALAFCQALEVAVGHRRAGPGALSPRRAPRDGAALQPRRRLRHDRQRHRLRGRPLALLPHPRAPAAAEQAAHRQPAAARRRRSRAASAAICPPISISPARWPAALRDFDEIVDAHPGEHARPWTGWRARAG